MSLSLPLAVSLIHGKHLNHGKGSCVLVPYVLPNRLAQPTQESSILPFEEFWSLSFTKAVVSGAVC